MIELKVEPYCHQCVKFEPMRSMSYFRDDIGKPLVITIEVRCENYETCKEIEKYISGQIKNGE